MTPDTDFITSWSLDRQRAAEREAEARCQRCTHGEHGLPCATFRNNACPCPSSFPEVTT